MARGTEGIRCTGIPPFSVKDVTVITHGHLDHMGGAHEFTDVRAHPGENIQAPRPGSLLTAALFTELGMPPMANTAFGTPDDLDRTLRRELRRIQLRPHLIDGCLTATDLTLTPPTPP
jgi:glyoxylase-like metal-dependent hydrolase (beta-lactamase superfamily II)